MWKNKLSWVILSLAIFAISMFVLFKTPALTVTKNYVEGSDYQEITVNTKVALEDKNFLIFSRNDRIDVEHIVDCVYDDPELFWIAPKYHRLTMGDYELLVFETKYNKEDIGKQIEDAGNAIIAEIITEDMTAYDKILTIHDWMCNNITYKAAEDSSDQDIYGALVNKQALCAGYAEGFKYLLGKVGIDSKVISGEAIDKDGNRISHAWNIVYIDGKAFYFDVTWDDFQDKIVYDWFGLSLEMFQFSHFPSQGYEWEPSVGVDVNYYAKKGMYINQCNAETIANQIKQQGRTFTVMCANQEIYSQVIQIIQDKNELLKIMRSCGIVEIENPTYLTKRNSLCLTITL